MQCIHSLYLQVQINNRRQKQTFCLSLAVNQYHPLKRYYRVIEQSKSVNIICFR